DAVVLDVERERAAHAAVGADRVGRALLGLVPRARRAHVVLALEHEGAGRADADAVAAVDAGRVGQRHVGLGGDARVETAAGHGDRERVLGVDAARLHALVAEHALRVVAHVEIVVDLHRLRDGLRALAHGRLVMSGLAPVALTGGSGRGRPAVPLRTGAIARHHVVEAWSRREIARGSQALEQHAPGHLPASGLGLARHPGLDGPRARRAEGRRAGHL